MSGHRHLILGAFGCGAFGNPAQPVAAIFREQLASPEFRGAFARVVFAIIDPMGTGNLRPFREEMAKIETEKGLKQGLGSPRQAVRVRFWMVPRWVACLEASSLPQVLAEIERKYRAKKCEVCNGTGVRLSVS